MAIIKEGNVIASTFSQKGAEPEELEFSEELLQDIKALKGQTLPVDVEDNLYTMKSIPLRDEAETFWASWRLVYPAANSTRPPVP